jgi:probable rRNA maturation factor
MSRIEEPPLAWEVRDQVEVVTASDLWACRPGAEELAAALIGAAISVLGDSSVGRSAVDIVLTDDASIRRLNRDWRGIDKPTNVLSFPTAKLSAADTPAMPLGDIVIAYETTEREAEAEEKVFMHHFAHLVVHGFLHLLGYDHDSDRAAEDMERVEAEILARFDMPDPYTVRN